MLVRLAWRNIFRNSRRSLLTASGIALCTFFVILALTHLMGALWTIEEDLLVTTGHIRLVHKEYVRKQRLMSLRWHVEDLDKKLSLIHATAGIVEAAPRISCGAMVDVGGESQQSTVCVGLDQSLPGERRRIEEAVIAKDESLNEFFKESSGELKRLRHLVIGKAMVEKLGGVKPGAIVTVIFRTRTACIAAGNYKVAAIVDMKAGQLNRFLYIPMKDITDLIEMEGRATELLIFTESSWGLKPTVEKLQALIPDKDLLFQIWNEVGVLGSALKSLYIIFGIVIGVILLVAAIGVGNTMVMAVLERTREIGLMEALGFHSYQIISLFLLEGFFLGLSGIVPGVILGIFGGLWLETEGLDITTDWAADVNFPVRDVLYGKLSTDIIIVAAVLGLAVAVLGSLGPALRAARMKPVDALRTE